jgi:peptidoglycan hydrolase-like protein with peptidoglycan-binding domain
MRLKLEAAISIALTVSACGAPDAQHDPVPGGEPAVFDLAQLDHNLSLGSEGDDVQAIHHYLTQYGYFPNPELQRQFPAWRPMVPRAPKSPWVFDENTAEGVRRLQTSLGLAETGVVDEDTRAFLQEARCGVPDGIDAADPSQKFALSPGTWWTRGSTVLYKVLNTLPSQLDLPTFKSIVDASFRTWQDAISYNAPVGTISGLYFAPTTGTPKISIQFGSVGAGALAATTVSPTSVTVTLSNSTTWNLANNASSNFDLKGTLIHELGHAVGLAHSSLKTRLTPTTFDKATMFPVVNAQESFTQRTLDLDDKVALASRYNVFMTLVNAQTNARDIGVGADGSVWIVGSTPFGDGFRVSKWDGLLQIGHWLDSDGGAVRIAVGPTGIPWVVTAGGFIYRHTTSSTTTGIWEILPGRANDIGIGANGEVWIIGIDRSSGGFGIYKWNEGIFNWNHDLSNGAAVRITVGPAGVPWVVNEFGDIFRYTTSVGCGRSCSTNDPNVGIWEFIPNKKAVDIGIGGRPIGTGGDARNYLWTIERLTNGSLNLAVWDEQDADTVGSPVPPKVAAFTQGWQPCQIDTTSSIAVGPTADPFFTCANGQVLLPLQQ